VSTRFRFNYSIAVLFLVGASIAWAAGSPEEELPDSLRAVDNREEWVLGVAEFGGRNLPEEARYLTQTVPLIIREDLRDARVHELSQAELAAYRRHLKDESLLAAGAALDNAIEARDRAEEAPPVSQAEEQVARARRNLERVERMEPESIQVAREKPIAVKGDVGGLLPATQSRAHLSAEEDLDALVAGVVRDLDGFVEIEVRVYGRFEEEIVFSERVITRPARAFEATQDLRNRVVEYALGRAWASLNVSSPNEDASLYVDGQFVGVGEARLPRTIPGLRTLRVELPSGASGERVVELDRFESQNVSIEVDAPAPGSVSIRTTPPGAAVYLESVWRGTTPLTIERPPQTVPFRITAEGYNDAFGSVGPGTVSQIDRRLIPAVVDQAGLVEERRDTFYTALGGFVLSLPVPIIFGGLYQSILSLFPPDGGPIPGVSAEESSRLARTGTAYFYISRGGLFVSTGLFVNVAVQLARYVQASQYKHQTEE
jgi:hypothetical protein